MKRKKLGIVISILAVATIIIGSVSCYKAFNHKIKENEVYVLGYREAEAKNVNGYQIIKYDNVRSGEWIDNDNILALKDNGKFSNPDSNISMSILSKYNLNSRDIRDYNDVILDTSEIHGISPSGRYVLYGEPRVIAQVGSEEWERASQSQELFHEKRDILDLETGEIITDFDKIVNNCSADYKWMSNDLIFVDYGGEWAILDREGNSIKRGLFDFKDCAHSGTSLVDVSDIQVSDEGMSGCFYYSKEFWTDHRSLGVRLYSMDVNTLEEKLIMTNDDTLGYEKHGDIIAYDEYNDNGEAVDGVFVNRTFGFKVADVEGKQLQEVGLPKLRNFNDLTLSPDGQKCAFLEVNGYDAENKKMDKSTLNNVLKVLDVKTGDVKEVVKVEDIMDKENEEEFMLCGEYIDQDGNKKVMKGVGPRISNIKWDKDGKSLIFNYEYTSKNDSQNYTNTYVVTFDK